MILLLDEQETITLKRCLSIFIEQVKEKMLVADGVEVQTALNIWDAVVEVETKSVEEVMKEINQITKEAANESRGTNSPHEPRTTYERDEPA